MSLLTYDPQRKSERVKKKCTPGGWTPGTPTTVGVTWHTSARRMPRFALCTTPASRAKKPRVRRLSLRQTLAFGVGPMEARGPQGREGARPSLPRGEAAATCEPQGKADAGSPSWALGDSEQELAPLAFVAKEEKQRRPHGLSFSSRVHCRTSRPAVATPSSGNVAPVPPASRLGFHIQNYNSHQA